MKIKVRIARQSDIKYAEEICQVIDKSAKVRGTGIAKRKPEYIRTKIMNQNAVLAFIGEEFAGFCYIELFESKKYVSNSGLVVVEKFRNMGVAKLLKKKVFELSRKKFPDAKIFGITTSLPVMKINSKLGYKPVTFSELTTSDGFWKGCQSCPNYDILQRNEKKMCLCVGMIYDPKQAKKGFIKSKTQHVKKIIKKGLIGL